MSPQQGGEAGADGAGAAAVVIQAEAGQQIVETCQADFEPRRVRGQQQAGLGGTACGVGKAGDIETVGRIVKPGGVEGVAGRGRFTRPDGGVGGGLAATEQAVQSEDERVVLPGLPGALADEGQPGIGGPCKGHRPIAGAQRGKGLRSAVIPGGGQSDEAGGVVRVGRGGHLTHANSLPEPVCFHGRC